MFKLQNVFQDNDLTVSSTYDLVREYYFREKYLNLVDFAINHGNTLPIQFVVLGKINYQQISTRKYFSNSFPTLYQQLNNFQIGILVGSLVFYWDESEIVIPRKYFSDPIMSITIEKNYPINKLEKKLDKLSKVLLDWNIKESFKKKNDFIYSIIDALEIHALVPKILEEHVEYLNQEGFSTYSFRLHKPIRHIAHTKEKRKFFHDHKSLDEFVKLLIENDPFFQFKFQEEYMFLKGIDDIFWKKHYKSQIEVKKVKNEIAELKKISKDTESKSNVMPLKLNNLEKEYDQLIGGQASFCPLENECPFLKVVE